MLGQAMLGYAKLYNAWCLLIFPRNVENYLKPKSGLLQPESVGRCEHFLVRSSRELRN